MYCLCTYIVHVLAELHKDIIDSEQYICSKNMIVELDGFKFRLIQAVLRTELKLKYSVSRQQFSLIVSMANQQKYLTIYFTVKTNRSIAYLLFNVKN